MVKVKFITLVGACLALSMAVIGCGQQAATPQENGTSQTDSKTPEATKVSQEGATYVGDQSCQGCHNKPDFAKTGHAGAFKPLSEFKLKEPAGEITVFDGSADPKDSISATIDLSKAVGVQMDHYVVVEMPKEAGFKEQYYRVAALEKEGEEWTVHEAAKVKDSEDWSAKAYTCGKCHSPGLGLEGTPSLSVSCESCHGAGSNHVKASNPADKKAAIKMPDTNTCLTCHESKPRVDKDTKAITYNNHYGTRNYEFSKHANNANFKGCISCHSVHAPNANGKQLKADKPEDICMTCHAGATFDLEAMMWKNPKDLHHHLTKDHSFGAIKYEDLGDDPETDATEVTSQPIVDMIKAKYPDLFK